MSRLVITTQQAPIEASALFASVKRKRQSSLSMSSVFLCNTVRIIFLFSFQWANGGCSVKDTKAFYFKSGATQLALSTIAVLDPPPLSEFAQLRTVCPKFCACYTISANNQWQCARNPIEPAPSCSMALRVWLGGRRISSGRPRCGSLRAAAAAAPALPTCCNKHPVPLALTVTAPINEVLSGAFLLPCAVSVLCWCCTSITKLIWALRPMCLLVCCAGCGWYLKG